MDETTSTPTFLKKRVKSKTVRARASSPTNDATENGDSEASPSTLASKLKNKQKARAKSRLSFGGDDEEGQGEVFKVKKSNLSRNLSRGAGASPGVALPYDLEQASISDTSGPIYDKEYLSQLKASTPSTPAKQPPMTTYDSDMSFDASELSGAVIENLHEIEETSFIPSESSIAAAKEKRERLRSSNTANGEDDFISLSVTRREDIHQGPHPESRLMREEDDLGDGDDEFAEFTSAQERIALGKKSKKKEAAKKREAMVEMINDAEEVDEETMEWEAEQIRRGGRGFTPERATVKEVYRPAPIPPPTPVPTLAPAIARLSQALSDLTTSHTASTSAMTALADERVALEEKEKEMRSMVEKAEAKRSWFAAFRDWVESVATFLDGKYPLLEKLEDEHVSLLKERSEMIAKRRQQDDEDALSLFFGSPPEQKQPETEELDELGRVIPQKNSSMLRRERQAERVTRRSRRKPSKEEEGYSTDATLPPSDASDFQMAMSNLATRVNNVLADVRADDFNDPDLGVAKWFGDWRKKYSDTYTGAYGGLGMVSAWEFWVRLEIVGWDPMEDPRSLDTFAWYSSLYNYSRPRTASTADDEEPELGPDGDLVSAMISTAVVPRLCKVVQAGAFDPYCTNHVKVLVDLAEQVEASVGADKFEMLVSTVVASFREAVNATAATVHTYTQLNQTHFDPQAIPARRRFLVRRVKLVSNIMRWRKYTGERFGIGELVTKVVAQCMSPVAESGWEVGGEEVMRKVAKLVPLELLPTNLKSLAT
ncbi:hypothetical protein BD410DRAFT_787584 [Rickenella mellea]|uniref:GCFC-domain-containing protein n=1 Tax=Rickenella mellea TaxID=50990 RepID=A0A4Y7Q736_9AGAM|nr:hypothetical protein BD410DRAFT_787584 [Rickenella mellea]